MSSPIKLSKEYFEIHSSFLLDRGATQGVRSSWQVDNVFAWLVPVKYIIL